MKKVLFLSLAASAVMASCSNEVLDSVVPQEPQAISFGNAYVDNNTRADVLKGDIKKFYVWGHGSGDPIQNFTDQEVNKDSDGKWVYNPTQYWNDAATYHFIAYANGHEGEALNPTYSEDFKNLTFTQYIASTNDLIVSNHIERKPGVQDLVELTFGHVLSKVKFTFVNKCGLGSNLDITGLQFNGTKTATYTTENSVWAPVNNGIYAYNEMKGLENDGSVTSNENYVIPQTTNPSSALKATFTITLNNTTLQDKKKVVAFNVDLSGIDTWAAGNVYNYTATITPETLDLKTIEFKPIVNDWTQEKTQVVTPVK